MEQIMKSAIDGLAVDYVDIRIERVEKTALVYLGPVLETVGTVFTLGGSVCVCDRGGWGFATFNKPEDAADTARIACENARLATRNDGTQLAHVDPVIAKIGNPMNIDPADIPLADKCEQLRHYNDIMLADAEIATTKSMYRDVKRTVWLHTSEGTMLEREECQTGMSFMAIARDGANVQRGVKSVGDRRGYDTVLGLDDEVGQLVKIARDLLKAPKVESGAYSVVLDPQLAGVFVHEAFGHLSEADFAYENPKVKEMMRLGRRFGPDFLTIYDDGSIPGESGTIMYDDEGVPKGKTPLIIDGKLVGRLHSRETAAKMGEAPTGNARAISHDHRPIVRMTSTYIENGDTPFDEMVAGIETGIYACGFLGGMTDLERFTFSSAHAYNIENGKITTPVRDVILAGNLFQTLHDISSVGNDLTLFGGLGGCGKGGQSPLPVSDGSPHIRIDNVLVG
jgi:TldD protein